MAKIKITREQIQSRKVSPKQPQRKTTVEGASKIPIDIMLVIDSSGSMEATDYNPTRFEAAKEAASFFATTKIVKGYQDRVGIATFGGDAVVVLPLTGDLRKVKEAISSLHQITHTSTAIGTALLRAADELTQDEPGRKKAIVLLTDGESFVGDDPAEVAQKLNEKEIPVFAIGIGTKKGQELSVGPVSLDEETLKHIAKITCGEYFYAPDVPDLKRIYQTLANL